MPFPIVFRKPGSPGLSVDFFDLTTRTGLKTFYGTRLDDAGTMKYALITDTLSSFSELDAPGATYALNAAHDLDFDLDVTTTLNIEGKAFVSVPINCHDSSAANDFDITATASLYKVSSGGVETQIGSTATQVMTIDITGIGTDSWNAFSARINVPRTTILNGEKIRLTVTTSAPGANRKVWIYHDPANLRTSSGILATQLKLQLPFRMNI